MVREESRSNGAERRWKGFGGLWPLILVSLLTAYAVVATPFAIADGDQVEAAIHVIVVCLAAPLIYVDIRTRRRQQADKTDNVREA